MQLFDLHISNSNSKCAHTKFISWTSKESNTQNVSKIKERINIQLESVFDARTLTLTRYTYTHTHARMQLLRWSHHAKTAKNVPWFNRSTPLPYTKCKFSLAFYIVRRFSAYTALHDQLKECGRWCNRSSIWPFVATNAFFKQNIHRHRNRFHFDEFFAVSFIWFLHIRFCFCCVELNASRIKCIWCDIFR